jgi:hypothetical protein
MPNYKFPPFETIFKNPTISINGDTGTKIVKNAPEDTAYCDILIETPQTSNSQFRLEGSPKPLDWTMEELSLWVAKELIKYQV